MKPSKKFLNLDPEFWANVKLLNQRLGYTRRVSKRYPEGGFVIPTESDIKTTFKAEGLKFSRLLENGKFTDFGNLIIEYFTYCAHCLTSHVEPNLMSKNSAKAIFYDLKNNLQPNCPLPLNKQKKEKKDFAFLTGIVNMLIESSIGDLPCDYDPKELTAITKNRFPVRTLSRRVDGAFPSVIDPIAIWEIKEYYHTTTFGSRVADGVYETQLDGWELREARAQIDRDILHYLIVDDYYTWWGMGRSYLCRLIDIMHMGLVTEVIFGREVIDRMPELVKGWKKRIE